MEYHIFYLKLALSNSYLFFVMAAFSTLSLNNYWLNAWYVQGTKGLKIVQSTDIEIYNLEEKILLKPIAII